MSEQREWLGVEDLATKFDVPVKTVYVWNSKGTGPRAARFGRHVRYRRADVEIWIAEQYGDARPAA